MILLFTNGHAITFSNNDKKRRTRKNAARKYKRLQRKLLTVRNIWQSMLSSFTQRKKYTPMALSWKTSS